MKRGTIFVMGIIGLLIAFFTIPPYSSVAAEKSLASMKPTVWRTQSIVPLGHFNSQVWVRFAEEVAQKTGGKLKIEVYPSGGLGHPIPKTVSIVRDGLMEVGQLLGAFVNGEFPLADVMELPGLVPENMDLRIEVAKTLTPFYQKVLPEKYNQYFLGVFQSDSRTVASAEKKIDELAAMKGLKMRASGPTEVGVCKALGVAPVSIATPEVYSAMQSKTVDACFGADSWFASGKFWEVSKYVYSMQFDGHQMIHTVNKDAFDALPPDVQAIVKQAAENSIRWVWPVIFSEKDQGRKMMISHGVKYSDITPQDWNKFGLLSKPIKEEWFKRGGPMGREMVDATQKVVKKWESKKK